MRYHKFFAGLSSGDETSGLQPASGGQSSAGSIAPGRADYRSAEGVSVAGEPLFGPLCRLGAICKAIKYFLSRLFKRPNSH
jgi:hypothetical protein